jgi:hypothetical protein
MVERRQLTDQHIALWREACALLDAMTKREYAKGESDRYYEFRAIDKKLTLRLVGPHSCSLFSAHLDGPPDPWVSPGYWQYIDWPVTQTWRAALIEATGITSRNFEETHHAV